MSETARWTGPAPPQQQQRSQQVNGRAEGANLADILERVLDKGIVIAGDIQVNLLDIELLTIKIRLVVASVERAKEMGIDWWERDPTLSAGRRELEDENKDLRARIEALERNSRRDADDGHELASGPTDGDPDGEPYDEDLEDVEDHDVEDSDVADDHPEDDQPEDDHPEDDHPEDLDEPGDGEPDEHDGPADDERPTRSNGRSGRAARAKADRKEAASDDDSDDGSSEDEPDRDGRSRSGRGRGRASRGAAERDGEERREMPVRRRPGSKRSSTSQER